MIGKDGGKMLGCFLIFGLVGVIATILGIIYLIYYLITHIEIIWKH